MAASACGGLAHGYCLSAFQAASSFGAEADYCLSAFQAVSSFGADAACTVTAQPNIVTSFELDSASRHFYRHRDADYSYQLSVVR